MKKRTLSRILAAALCLAMVLGLTACGDNDNNASNSTSGNNSNTASSSSDSTSTSSEPPADATYQKEIIIATGEALKSTNPTNSTGIAHLTVHNLTHDCLITADPETGEIVPELAESYEWIDDTTIQFNLRKGVKFHNGVEMKASDVKYTLEYDNESSYLSSRTVWIEDILTPDDYTVQVKLTDSAQDFLGYLTLSAFGIISEEAVLDDPETGYGIGTGPYYFDDYEFTSYIHLNRFDDYYGELPKTEKITFQIMTEAAARLVALQTGEVDIVIAPAATDYPTIQSDPSLNLANTSGVTLQYLALNVGHEKFQDVRVRQAIAYAINPDDVLALAAEGNGTIATTFLGDDCFGVDHDANKITYDPEKAKQLLSEAGAEGLEFTVYTISNVKNLQAQAIQANLRDIGVTMNIEPIELVALSTIMYNGQHEAVLYNWAGSPLGPDNVLRPLFYSTSASNRTMTKDSYVDDLTDQAMVETDSTKRAEMYSELQEYLLDQAGLIPLYWEDVNVATKASLQGFIPNNADIHEFASVYIVE